MENPFRIVLNAFLKPEEHDNDEKKIKAAEEAGEKAAEIGSKNAEFVPKAKVNEENAAKDAKTAKGAQNTKGGEGR